MIGVAEQTAEAFRAACRAELKALKPGNVHAFGDGHGMTVADFEKSAGAAAHPLAQPGAGVGRRILGAIEATRAAVGTNTNLGIVLLCAPLAAAAEASTKRRLPLRAALTDVLYGLTREDAELAFQAIALAAPGGLGTATRYDVRAPANCTLRQAMQEAASRDRIAKAYGDGFADVFETGLLSLARTHPEGLPDWWPTSVVYLDFLARFPDSHIARKFGQVQAVAVCREAAERSLRLPPGDPDQSISALLDFDSSLKARGLNPGTSADFTVATLFAAGLRDVLRQSPESG